MLLCDIQLAMCLELVFVISTDSLEWSQTVSINRTLIPITYLQCMFTGTISCCKRYLYEEYLRHRKHAPCFYQVIQTLVKVWENSKKLWKHSPAARVPTAFLVLPNFHSCLYNLIETRCMFSMS